MQHSTRQETSILISQNQLVYLKNIVKRLHQNLHRTNNLASHEINSFDRSVKAWKQRH
ncbi:hypothetical protein SynSYN20_01520 [Synechococcus sp. SYN20]|nr:hypothetical protein SynSYN20_01520 [Synechococcus sp. SYN20]